MPDCLCHIINIIIVIRKWFKHLQVGMIVSGYNWLLWLTQGCLYDKLTAEEGYISHYILKDRGKSEWTQLLLLPCQAAMTNHPVLSSSEINCCCLQIQVLLYCCWCSSINNVTHVIGSNVVIFSIHLPCHCHCNWLASNFIVPHQMMKYQIDNFCYQHTNINDCW